MKIIPSAKIIVEDLVSALKEGATFVYPTETCYALGCDATNSVAVKKVFELKGRSFDKSLIIIVADLAMMAPYIEITPMLKDIAKKYWPAFAPLDGASSGKPGALTVIVSLKTPLPLPLATQAGRPTRGEISKVDWRGPLASGVIANDGTIAFRVTSDPFARKLVTAFGKPIVSTSANLAGGANPYTIEEIVNSFRDAPAQPDIAVDAGVLPQRPPSTMIRLIGGRIEVVRRGDISV